MLKKLITIIAILTAVCFVSTACINRAAANGESDILKPKEVTFLKDIIEHHKGQRIVFYCWNPQSGSCIKSNCNIHRSVQTFMGERDDVAYVNIALATEKDDAWLNNKDTLSGEHYTVGKELYQTICASLAKMQPSALPLEFSLAAVMENDGGSWTCYRDLNYMGCYLIQNKLMTNIKGGQAVNPTALVGTKWELVSPVYEEKSKQTLEFKEDVYLDTSYDITCEFPYIISSKSQRGKGRITTKKGRGCFINKYNDKCDDTDYYVIVSFTPDKLVLFHPMIPGTIGGGDWMGVYKRIRTANPNNQETTTSDSEIKLDTHHIYDVVEQMPQFPGGTQAMMAYIASHLNYPEDAKDKCLSGRTVVQFVVEKDGNLSDVKIKKSVDPSLDEEAIRVIKSMPKWIPGRQNGKPVRVEYFVPVVFNLH